MAGSWRDLLGLVGGEQGGEVPQWVALAACAAASLAVYHSGSWFVKATTGFEYHPGTISGMAAQQLLKHSDRRRKTRPVRVYMDGCFDMMHYGHCNALRQARACGDELVVGLVPDEEIVRCKGPPVMTENERYVMVEGVKWVDEVIRGVPYELSNEFCKELFTKHGIDYIVHGDDPCILPDGTDAYAYCKGVGKYKEIPRTEGVSSTDIVGRMLLMARQPSHAGQAANDLALRKSFAGYRSNDDEDDTGSEDGGCGAEDRAKRTQLSVLPRTSSSQNFLPTSRRIVQFSSKREPKGRVVYIDGAFDMFHPGHVHILKEARKLGDFLLVGLHMDETISKHRGRHLPIMNLHERSLSVLACKHVDEVIIGAPWEVTNDLLTTFNIALVCHGTKAERNAKLTSSDPDPYAIPKSLNMFKEITSPHDMTTSTMVSRILDNLEIYKKRNASKAAKEKDYYENRTHKAEY